ncbi:MAG TPA: SRPBCC family protein [Vicinamibacterales bacterium]|nr:SRPBCC family protein [Vicinamibacterales bacterium]
MSYMDIEFPGDVREARVRQGRNISDLERWTSVAAGAGLAVYGVSRRSARGWLMAGLGALLVQRGVSGHCHTYDALGISTAGTGQDTRQALSGDRGVNVAQSVVINRSVEELYRFWHSLENLPRFMRHLESVERVTDTLSRWRAKGPGGLDVEWNAEIINEVPNKVIGWQSLEGSDVVSAGSVHFEDIGIGGTRLRVRLQYSVPGGKVGAAVAWLMGRDPATEIREDLEQFKALAESGRLTASDA